MGFLANKINGILDRVLAIEKISCSEGEMDSLKEENFAIYFIASEAIENGLVEYGSYILTQKGSELLGETKEIFTKDFIDKNILNLCVFPTKQEEFIFCGIKACQGFFQNNILDRKSIEDKCDLWGIRVVTFLFSLMVFVIDRSINDKILRVIK